MGNCLITVHSVGPHHNGQEYDADQIAARMVDEMKAKGHSITHASITTGGENNLLDDGARFPLKSEKPEFYNR